MAHQGDHCNNKGSFHYVLAYKFKGGDETASIHVLLNMISNNIEPARGAEDSIEALSECGHDHVDVLYVLAGKLVSPFLRPILHLP